MWRLNDRGAAEKTNMDFADLKLAACGEAPATDELVAGRPFSGRAGALLNRWIFSNAGIDGNEVLTDNTIRCAQPDNEMPPVEILREAWRHCRQYDRWDEMPLAADLITFHPASLLRDAVPLPLVIADAEKAKRFSQKHGAIRLLLGRYAAMAFQPYAENVSKWRGHFAKPGDRSEDAA